MFPHLLYAAPVFLGLIFALVLPFMLRQQTVPLVVQVAAPAPPVAVGSNIDIEKRIQSAVARAVADSEARQHKQTAELLAAADKRHNLELRSMQVSFEEGMRLQMKQLSTMYVALNRMDDGSGR